MEPYHHSYYHEVYKKDKKVQQDIFTSKETNSKINDIHGIKTLRTHYITLQYQEPQLP